MSVSWEPNPKGVDELLSSAQAASVIADLAAMVGQQVERAWPKATGRGARSVVTGSGEEDGRAVGYVGSTSPFWHLVEYGSTNNAPYRPFARGVQAAGLDYEAT